MTDASIIHILSLMFCAIGIGIILNPTFYKKILEDFTENESMGYLGAMIAFTIGFFLITLRSGAEGNVAMMITVFG